MIAQPELHNLLILPLAERLRIAQRLIESALAEAGDKGETMAVTIALPEPIEQQLRRAWGNLDRKALEALAIEGYRAEALSAGQVAELLGLSVIEMEACLKERGVDLGLTIEDFERDQAALKQFIINASESTIETR
jgi:predicted HTH domain antitoxin